MFLLCSCMCHSAVIYYKSASGPQPPAFFYIFFLLSKWDIHSDFQKKNGILALCHIVGHFPRVLPGEHSSALAGA